MSIDDILYVGSALVVYVGSSGPVEGDMAGWMIIT